MRRMILCVLVAVACGDDGQPAHDDASPGTPDAPAQGLVGCLDTADLPMAPNGQLPCDLVPPGLRP